MTETRIEKLESPKVRQWAYDRYVRGDLVYSEELQGQKHPVVAVITLNPDDIKRFSPELDKAKTIIIHHKILLHKPINNIDVRYPMQELVFKVEYPKEEKEE